ncbi:MAG: Fe3+/spermidine/putrescine ABC transporter ATP-binding protein [Anaerolineaceae bacterium]|nr:Fe3+/spermidine/putrescine ABC transporter ATP-binding protein [Anaerolineaceae bacterium]
MLTVENIYKDYENQPLLKGVSFEVKGGETVCLLGRSGSGKSTLLRIIAGIESSKSGRVLWNGKDLQGVPVHQRQFGFMFQDYALFPHLSVLENVSFGLKMQGMGKEERTARAHSALEQVNMGPFAQRWVTELSGGEQQRVALARSLAPQPRLLMLDEPLGALDRTLREQLMQELREVLHQTQIPTIYVTHDQEEAFTIGDRLILLNQGKIVQEGSPQQVYDFPKNSWVAAFLGLTNLVKGTVVEEKSPVVETALGSFVVKPPLDFALAPGSPVTLLIRPQAAEIRKTIDAEQNLITVFVKDCVYLGAAYRIQVEAQNQMQLDLLVSQPVEIGETILIYFKKEYLTCLEG